MALATNVTDISFVGEPQAKDAALTRRANRMYSAEAASIVARLDWSDDSLADRVETALIVGAPFTTTTQSGVWAIKIHADRRVNIVCLARPARLTGAVMSVRLLDLHGEFFE